MSQRFFRYLQVALFLAVEASWLFAWSVALGAWIDGAGASPVVGLLGVVAILVGAAGLTRLAGRRPGRAGQLVVAVAGLLVAGLVGFLVLQGVRGDRSWAAVGALLGSGSLGFRLVGAAGLALVAWWRGIAGGRARLGLDQVEAGVRGAVLALVGAFVLNALVATPSQAPEGPLLLAALVVLFAGLLGLPLARVLDLGAGERTRGRPGLGVSRHWLGLLVGAVAALLLVTLVLAAIFTFQRLDQLLAPLGSLLDTVLYLVVYAIAVPLGLLIEGIIDLVRLLLHPGQPPPTPPLPMGNLLQQLRSQAGPGGGPPAWLVLLGRVAVGVLVAGVVALLLARAVAKLTAPAAEDEVEEARDFVLTWDGALRALRAWLRARFSRPRRVVDAPVAVRAPSAPADPGLDPRALYRELLRLGARLGRRRGRSETPREYERALADLPPLAPGDAEIDLLTSLYARARYGEEPPDAATAAEAREALERLKAMVNANTSGGGVG